MHNITKEPQLDIILNLLCKENGSSHILLKGQVTACKVQLADSKAGFADPNNSKVQLEEWYKSYVCALERVNQIQKWPQNPVYCKNIFIMILKGLFVDAKAMQVKIAFFQDIAISDIEKKEYIPYIDLDDSEYFVKSEYIDESTFDSKITMLKSSVVTHINGQTVELKWDNTML